MRTVMFARLWQNGDSANYGVSVSLLGRPTSAGDGQHKKKKKKIDINSQYYKQREQEITILN